MFRAVVKRSRQSVARTCDFSPVDLRTAPLLIRVFALTALSMVVHSSGSEAATSLTFSPSADATLLSGSPNSNYGSSSVIEVDGSSNRARGLLKFKVSGVNGRKVSSAVLRLYVRNGSSGSGGRFHRVSSSSWRESTVTHANAPAFDSTPFASLGAVKAGTWQSVDVSSIISADGTYSIGISSSSSDGVDYSSRNSSSNKPMLILSMDGTSGTPSPSASPSSSPSPSESPTPSPSPSKSVTPSPSPSMVPSPSSSPVTGTVRAFPGAEGFGRNTRGAYALYYKTRSTTDLPKILKVTNLNDSGTGSLRAALTASGPRVVVFTVGGRINLNSLIYVNNPYLTMAAQTAPGAGVTVANYGIIIRASEVILRNIRIRITGKQQDGLAISAPGTELRNIVIDHCSVSWAADELIGVNGTNGGVKYVSIQNCLLAEGVLDHSMAILLNGFKDHAYGPNYVTIVRNLMTNTQTRLPSVGNEVSAEVINNVMYNWGPKASYANEYANVNYLGNYYKAGPMTTNESKAVGNGASPTYIYVRDNLGPGRQSESDPQDHIVTSGERVNVVKSPASIESGSKVIPPRDTYTYVNAHSGSFPRDAVDARVVKDVQSGTAFKGTSGKFLSSEADVGGVPSYPSSSSTEKDTDGDGIPDAWELVNGLNPSVFDAHGDRNGDGYPDIESYINSFFDSDGRFIP